MDIRLMDLEFKLIFRGFKYNLLISLICFFSISLMGNNHVINLFTQIILPGYVGYILTRRWLSAFTLIAINDIFLSYSGLYFRSLGFPYPRSIMFALTLFIFVLNLLISADKPFQRKLYFKGSQASLFYGLVFPLSLVLVSLSKGNATIGKAFGDVLFMFPALMYFPIVRLLKNGTSIVIGWIMALALAQAIQSLIISLGPRNIAITIYQNYSNIMTDAATIDHFLNSGNIIRNASTAFIVSFIGIFAALIIINQNNQKLFRRVLAGLFLIVCLSPLAIDALRGPLLSVLLIAGFITVSSLISKKGFMKTIRLIVLGIVVISFVRILLIQYVPSGYARFTLYSEGATVFIGNDRMTQHDVLLNEFKENPFFGRGVGAGLHSGYERAISGTDFELQYHMFLYKMGVILFIIFILPFLWVFSQLIVTQKFISDPKIKWTRIFNQSLIYSICATCIAGITNPYIKTGYLTLTITILYAMVNEGRIKKSQYGSHNDQK
jgi:hypothetical protein